VVLSTYSGIGEPVRKPDAVLLVALWIDEPLGAVAVDRGLGCG
jgi:hypothetical protein